MCISDLLNACAFLFLFLRATNDHIQVDLDEVSYPGRELFGETSPGGRIL